MIEDELYDATRGVWKLGSRRSRAKYALAVFEGVARQVYEIEGWHPAGTTPYKTRTQESVDRPGRWEFTGRVASDDLRSWYVGSSVGAYFPQGLQSPVVYVHC